MRKNLRKWLLGVIAAVSFAVTACQGADVASGAGAASDIAQAAGKISGEFVMCYPPGIPILAPGEVITQEIVEYILYAKEKGCSMQGTEDPKIERLMVLV